MLPILLLALGTTAKGPPPPKPLALRAAPGLPLLASPSFTPDGRELLVVRTGEDGGRLYLVPVNDPGSAHAVEVTAGEGPSCAALSHDGKHLAWLARGELWVAGMPEEPGEPTRLYPPAAGGTPLGLKLQHFVWGAEDDWILIQSPDGWARLALADGGITLMPAHPVDLAGGSVALGGDGLHAAFVRPTSGPGWINGAKVIGVNLGTGQAQMADFDNDYTELLVLRDSQLAGKDSSGKLWVLRGRTRVPYFEPPAVPADASIGDYALSVDGGRIAYVVSFGDGERSQLWVGAAPKPPPWPKRE